MSRNTSRGRRKVSGERRIITMLFCDVADSTSMAENLDPEEWAEIMNEAFLYMLAPIEHYGGTVARMMGDGFLAFFGAPVAHEDDPYRAVLAAIDIQEELSSFSEELREDYDLEFAVRVGINTGPVVVGDIGSERYLEYTAMGDAINLAARMEDLAKPGTVLISEFTYRFVAPFVEVASLGKVGVKGKEEPVEAYRVIAPKEKPGRVRGIEGLDSPLIGRQDELIMLRNFLTELEDGRGRIIFMTGEAGLGKSRLIQELHHTWLERQTKPGSWTQSQGLAYETSRPYSLFHQRMADSFSIRQDDSPEEVRRKIANGLQNVPEELRSPIRLAVETLLDVEEKSGGLRVEAEALRRELFAGIEGVWRNQAEEHPMVAIFDDLHWSDPASADLLIHLSTLVTEVPILMLCALRPEKQSEGYRVKESAAESLLDHFAEIIIEGLTSDESQDLINSLLTISDLPLALQEKIQQKSEGNPFFVEEVIRNLIEKGILIRDESGSRWQARDSLQEIDIPDSLRALLIGRIDRLGVEAKRTLQMASVIGRSFYERILNMVAGAEQNLSRELALLLESQLILESATAPEVEYIFRHELTRDATYETLLHRQRSRYHRLVGESIERLFPERLGEEADHLAHHYMEAGDKVRALDYFTMAGKRAAKLYANPEAVRSFDQAISLARRLAEPQRVIDLYIERGRVLEVSGRYEEALKSYQELEEMGRSQENRQMILAGVLAQATVRSTYTDVFDPHKAKQLCKTALLLAKELGDYEAEAKTYWNMMLQKIYSGSSDLAGMIKDGERSLAISRTYHLHEQTAYTLNDLIRPYGATGQLDKAFSSAEEAGKLFLSVGNMPMYVDNRANFSFGLGLLGRLDEALVVSREAVKVSEEIGTLWARAYSKGALAVILVELGYVGQAIKAMEAAIRLGNEGNFFGPRFYVGSQMAFTLGRLGDYQHAIRALTALKEDGLRNDKANDWFDPYIMLAHLYIDLGDLDSADEQLKLLRKEFDSSESVENSIDLYPRYIMAEGRFNLAQRRIQLGKEQLDRAIALVRKSGLLFYESGLMGIYGLMLYTDGQHKEAAEILKQATSLARDMGAKWQLLPLLRDLRQVLKKNGDNASAEKVRIEAKDLLEFMAEDLSNRDLQQLFLNLPANREIIG